MVPGTGTAGMSSPTRTCRCRQYLYQYSTSTRAPDRLTLTGIDKTTKQRKANHTGTGKGMIIPGSHKEIRKWMATLTVTSLMAIAVLHQTTRIPADFSDYSVVHSDFSTSTAGTLSALGYKYCLEYDGSSTTNTNLTGQMHLGNKTSDRQAMGMGMGMGMGVSTSTSMQDEGGQACSPNSSVHGTDTEDIIRIATTLDQNYFDLVFPSWLHALSRSNSRKNLALYILTVELSPRQRCLIRTVVKLWLPLAEVYTIPFDTAEFQTHYTNKGKHISISTQSRLRLPSLLPCVDKIAWIDLDAFVVRSLKDFWSYPVAPCGITARLDNVRYLNLADLPNDIKWHDAYGYSFNAGVLLLSLDTLRRSGFEENIVQYWAIDLGYNDQVVLNMACNGTQGLLNETMNMLMNTDFSKTKKPNKNWVTHLYYPKPREWIIVHFISSRKPWSSNPSFLPNFNRVWHKYKLPMIEALKGRSVLEKLMSFLADET